MLAKIVIFFFTSLWRLVAAPAPGPAAAAGAVGIFATAFVVVGRLASAAEVASPTAGHTPVASPAAVEASSAATAATAVAAAASATGAVEAPWEDRAGISRLATGSELMIQGSLGAALFLVGVGLAGTLVGSASMSSTIDASLSARTL